MNHSPNNENIEHDRRLADDFLSSNDYQLNATDLIARLDECESCREYLEANAADSETWNEAGALLKPGEFDQSSVHSFSAATLADATGHQPAPIQRVLEKLAPTDDPHRLGRLGNYEISGVVGVGGMGVVLKAHDPSLERVVAIKVMAPELNSNTKARQRFAREAKAAAAVLHPNVVPIYSVFDNEEVPYLVMAYVRGGSLQARLEKNGPLPLVEVLRLGSQIAAGLDAAHEQGLVHRDIKPENILLEEGVERVTITDFGLARAVDDNTVTKLGSIAGTPQYMSPEQARGEQVDQQSDLFSLGSVMYTLCTGRPPFRDETSYGVMRKIIDQDATPIHQLNADIPVWMSSLVERMMAKEKSDRFTSAREVHELLEACLRHLQQPSANPLPAGLKKSKRTLLRENAKRILIGTGLLPVVVMLCLVAWQSTRPYSPTNFGGFRDLFTDYVTRVSPAEEPTLTSGRVTIGDAQRLLGSWQVVNVPLHWSLSGESKHQGRWYTFEKDRFLSRNMDGSVPSKGQWKINDSTGPRRISLDVDGAETKAIYALQSGYLSIFYRPGENEYPNAFPKPFNLTESGVLLVLQRTELPDVEFPHSDPTPEEAKLLASYKNNLILSAVSELDPKTAAMFTSHEGILTLPALHELTPDAARALAARDGVSLRLGLKSISPAVAKELAKAKSGVSLALESISSEAATELASLTSLHLHHLRSVTPETAEALASHDNWLSLASLTTLDVEVAQALAAHPGWLSLNGIRSITPQAAEALGSFRGRTLDLDGLQTLDIESAEHLAKAQPSNTLSLNGLKTLTPEVAAALVAGNHRHLSLQGLEELSEESLSILRRHQRRKIQGNTGGMLLPSKFQIPR